MWLVKCYVSEEDIVSIAIDAHQMEQRDERRGSDMACRIGTSPSQGAYATHEDRYLMLELYST